MDSELGVEDIPYTEATMLTETADRGEEQPCTMYISNSLNHSASPLFDDVAFDCAAWSTVRLTSNKTLFSRRRL